VLRKRALEKLIAVEVSYQAGQKLDIPDLDKRVEVQIKNYKSKHAFQASKWTDAELRESIRRNIYITEYFKNVGVVDPEIPEADIKQYYDENRESFTREAYVHARHILVQVASDAKPETKAAARQKIDQARQDLLAGKPFGKVAKEYSEDNIASAGGDLGYIKKGYMPPKFDQVAFALETHTLSDVVETKYGYHLIEVLDKQPAGVIPYEEMKDFIGKYLKMQVSKKNRETVIQSLRAKAEVEIVDQK
jgi:peptidyl-prolyl cis-trans isomerase C